MSDRSTPFEHRLIAEAVGTFALVFAGTGAIVVDQLTGGSVTHVGVSLTFFLVVTAMVYAVGDVSGAHINPAVTVGFWAAGRFPRRHVLPYVMSQSAGAVIASLGVAALFGRDGSLGSTRPSGGLLQAFALEALLTLLLMYTILQVATGAKEKGIVAGIAIGATVGVGALFGGPVSGASMNPARSLGPAVVSASPEHLWLYVLAPTLGALGAVFVYSYSNGGAAES